MLACAEESIKDSLVKLALLSSYIPMSNYLITAYCFIAIGRSLVFIVVNWLPLAVWLSLRIVSKRKKANATTAAASSYKDGLLHDRGCRLFLSKGSRPSLGIQITICLLAAVSDLKFHFFFNQLYPGRGERYTSLVSFGDIYQVKSQDLKVKRALVGFSQKKATFGPCPARPLKCCTMLQLT